MSSSRQCIQFYNCLVLYFFSQSICHGKLLTFGRGRILSTLPNWLLKDISNSAKLPMLPQRGGTCAWGRFHGLFLCSHCSLFFSFSVASEARGDRASVHRPICYVIFHLVRPNTGITWPITPMLDQNSVL